MLLILSSGCTGKDELVSQSISPVEDSTVSVEQLTVEIPAGTIATEEKLVISSVEKIPDVELDALTPLRSYEIELGDEGYFEKEITLSFDYDASLVPEGIEALDYFTVASYNEEDEVWVESQFDIVDDKIVVKTTHFSPWTLFGLSDGYVVSTAPHFTIKFDDSLDASGLGAYEIYGYTAKVRSLLEESYDAYVNAGFTAPKNKISVYVIKSDESYYNPLTGNIIISTQSYSDVATKQEISHELFHLFQNQVFYSRGMDMRRWWIEATADYAADEIALKTGAMGKDVKPRYLETTITTVDSNHEYSTSHFIDYMASNGVPFKGIWGAVAKDSAFTGVDSSLDSYIKENHKSSLKDEYADFAGFFLFNANSPIKLEKGLDEEVVAYKEDISTGDTTEKVKVKLNSGYTAKLVAITADVHSGSTTRGVSVEALSGMNENNVIQLYKAIDGERTKAVYVASLTDNGKQAQVSLKENDVLYAVVITGGSSSDQEIELEIEGSPKEEMIPVEFEQTYYLEGGGKVDITVEGSITGFNNQLTFVSKKPGYPSEILDITGFVTHADQKTSRITLTPDAEFASESWRWDSANEYWVTSISNPRYRIYYYGPGPDYAYNERESYGTLEFVIQPPASKDQQLLADVNLKWDYTTDHYRSTSDGEELVSSDSGVGGVNFMHVLVHAN
ncbi:hypothetical protein [Methanolobus sp. WCC4]|uniref:hypothetical protein n=1 Tax=Methanolobus sp. WCC4 TaxID=3125784 RepID=UPI0030F89795